MATPPVGTGFVPQPITVPLNTGNRNSSGGGEPKRRSIRLPFGLGGGGSDQVSHSSSAPSVSISAPTLSRKGRKEESISPPQSRSAPITPPGKEGVNWHDALQHVKGSPEKYKSEFLALFKILKDLKNNNDQALIPHSIFPYVRLSGAYTWNDDELVKAIEKVLECMENAMATGIHVIEDEPITKLGEILLKNTQAQRILKENETIRDRWIEILIEYQRTVGVERNNDVYTLLQGVLPSIRIICIVLVQRQKRVVEKIKNMLNRDDVRLGTIKSNPVWMNEQIVRQLDLEYAYKQSQSEGTGYFRFMDKVCDILFNKQECIGATDGTAFQESLSRYFTGYFTELTTHRDFFTKIKEKDPKGKKVLLHYIETAQHYEDVKDLATYHYEHQNYEKCLEVLGRRPSGHQQRMYSTLNTMLNQTVLKGINYLQEKKEARIPIIKEKMSNQECADSIKEIAAIVYPSLARYVEDRWKEYCQKTKTEEKEQKEKLEELRHQPEEKEQKEKVEALRLQLQGEKEQKEKLEELRHQITKGKNHPTSDQMELLLKLYHPLESILNRF